MAMQAPRAAVQGRVVVVALAPGAALQGRVVVVVLAPGAALQGGSAGGGATSTRGAALYGIDLDCVEGDEGIGLWGVLPRMKAEGVVACVAVWG